MFLTRIMLIIIALFFISFGSCQPDIEDILLTNQYLLVSQYGCVTKFEAQVPAGSCPQIMKEQTRPSKPCLSNSFNMHLIRDPEGKLPPRIGLVQLQKQLYFRIIDINVSQIFDEDTHKTTDSLTWQIEQGRMESNTFVFRYLADSVTSIYSIFDSSAQILYILRSNSDGNRDKMMLESVYLGHLFNDNERTVSRTMSSTIREIHNKNLHRFDWSEDAYSKKVYYKEHVDDMVVTYEVPMDRLFVTLMDGKPGKAIREDHENWRFLSSSGGIYSEKKVTTGVSRQHVASKIISLSSGNESMTCSYTTDNAAYPQFNPVLVIRDHDYCLLRYGREMSSEKCIFERNEWLHSRGLLQSTGESILKWLLVTIIVLVMIVTLLLVYIYWLRSTFATEEDGIQRNDLDHEASLFVAKQRSFASSYPDPALLDVSVDKWN